MKRAAGQLASRMVGNSPDAAILQILFGGCAIASLASTWIRKHGLLLLARSSS